jgi:hypothetical protein
VSRLNNLDVCSCYCLSASLSWSEDVNVLGPRSCVTAALRGGAGGGAAAGGSDQGMQGTEGAVNKSPETLEGFVEEGKGVGECWSLDGRGMRDGEARLRGGARHARFRRPCVVNEMYSGMQA